ncbi:hypothetical protein C8J55DRAFT_487639 [Lentinula edodes]|uniref:Uncharacterized protein n=1 Tax=Lentinula lateritia TaxID=40482 RepID=A0A9W9DV35_9AGAR|nr:hypothetical protein C8J55DRAFT_487639 [Lentinula edodes]
MHAQGPRSPVSSTSPTVMRQRREALYPHNKPPPKLDLFSFNEDEDGTLAETIGNLHGRLEFSGPTEKGIREMFNMTFLNDGRFRHAIFYPSDLMQGLLDGKAKMILVGKDRWVAISSSTEGTLCTKRSNHQYPT